VWVSAFVKGVKGRGESYWGNSQEGDMEGREVGKASREGEKQLNQRGVEEALKSSKGYETTYSEGGRENQQGW